MLLEPDHKETERRAQLIAEDWNGIHATCLAFYQLSIRYSAERCIESFLNYQESLKQETNADYLFGLIQEAVGYAAALSRYFWPSPSGSKGKPQLIKLRQKRGEYLRILFNLDNNSPLYNRELRNAWEHFDERLDLYLLEKISGMFFPCAVIGSHKEADDPIRRIFKLLDPDEECLVLMGKKYFFAPIRNEVIRIYNNLNKEENCL